MRYITEDLAKRVPRLIQWLSTRKNRPFEAAKQRLGAFTDEELIYALAQYDPTGNLAKYVEWILRRLVARDIRLPEDGDRIKLALHTFDAVKGKGKFKGERDINKYKHLSELEAGVKDYTAADGEVEEPQTLRAWTKWIEQQGYKLLFKDDYYTVLLFKLAGTKIKVGPARVTHGVEQNWVPDWALEDPGVEGRPGTGPAKSVYELDVASVAMSKLATGTHYCVANPSTAESYLKRGPLYAIFKKSQESGKKVMYILADDKWSQVANTDDVMLSLPSPHLAYFMAKMVLEGNLDPYVANKLRGFIKSCVEEHDTLPEKPKSVMVQAIQSGQAR